MAQRLLFRHGSLVRPAAAAACACGLALQQRSEPSNSLFASKPSFDAVEPEKKLAQYEMGAELGQGAFGVVKIATKSGVQYALKIVKKRSKLCDAMAEKEAELLRAVSPHDNIVGLVDAFELPTEYAFVMDLARGGEASRVQVFDRICDNGPFSERAAADVVRQVALALDHANKRGVCHRDIKPENLLLTDGSDKANVKLCDFGCAAFIPKDQPVTGRWGTAGYMAPEVIRGDGYGPAVDSFSLGAPLLALLAVHSRVLLFILLGGYNPFDPGGDSADPVIEKRVLSNQWAFDPECFGSVSKEAKDLITKLLSTAPERRPTSSDLLANKWVMGNASAAP
ncbi:hypothetical protein EMIHUDRAFT_69328, partial [Emiliania huxleyi CCMP1516]|uniref:Protein kinase domain-containing protein n=2 Tax=Emiliania huxleyi TaxID=2903 RepID=A0A0D3HXX2_EMIH1